MGLFERVCRPHVQLPGCKITCGAKKKKEKRKEKQPWSAQIYETKKLKKKMILVTTF